MPAKKNLSEKIKKFCREYIIDFNAGAAYIRAGYSPKGARQGAFRLLTNVDVQAYLVELIKKQAAKTEKSAEDVIDHLTKIAFSNLKDFVKWNKDGVQIKSSGSKKVDGTLLTEVSETITENTTNKHIKLKDGLKALELLGRHLGLFEDRLRVINEDLHITVKLQNVGDGKSPSKAKQ